MKSAIIENRIRNYWTFLVLDSFFSNSVPEESIGDSFMATIIS